MNLKNVVPLSCLLHILTYLRKHRLARMHLSIKADYKMDVIHFVVSFNVQMHPWQKLYRQIDLNADKCNMRGPRNFCQREPKFDILMRGYRMQIPL